MSRHNLLSAQNSNACLHNPSCSYSMHVSTICNVASSNVLGRLVQCEQKGWDRGRWIGIHTKRVNTAGLCVGLAVKSLCRVTVLKNRHLTGPPCCVQVRFISIELASSA